MRLTTDNFILEKTTHAIVEDPEVLTKANRRPYNDRSLAVIGDLKKKPRHRASDGNINPVRRLVSTSSSTSSQSLTNCCQYVSVVVTNEQTAMDRENNITCHTNLSNQFAHDNVILDPNDSRIPNKMNNSIELMHNDSIDKDIPSDVTNFSCNHDKVDNQPVIIEHDEKSESNMDEADIVLQNHKEYVNVKQSDSVAFTDESCIQYIDSEESVDNEV